MLLTFEEKLCEHFQNLGIQAEVVKKISPGFGEGPGLIRFNSGLNNICKMYRHQMRDKNWLIFVVDRHPGTHMKWAVRTEEKKEGSFLSKKTVGFEWIKDGPEFQYSSFANTIFDILKKDDKLNNYLIQRFKDEKGFNNLMIAGGTEENENKHMVGITIVFKAGAREVISIITKKDLEVFDTIAKYIKEA